MSLVVLLLCFGVIMGTSAHISLTAFTVASAAIAVWLLAFAIREAVGRHRG